MKQEEEMYIREKEREIMRERARIISKINTGENVSYRERERERGCVCE